VVAGAPPSQPPSSITSEEAMAQEQRGRERVACWVGSNKRRVE
jgi:hypothetical protein